MRDRLASCPDSYPRDSDSQVTKSRRRRKLIIRMHRPNSPRSTVRWSFIFLLAAYVPVAAPICELISGANAKQRPTEAGLVKRFARTQPESLAGQSRGSWSYWLHVDSWPQIRPASMCDPSPLSTAVKSDSPPLPTWFRLALTRAPFMPAMPRCKS